MTAVDVELDMEFSWTMSPNCAQYIEKYSVYNVTGSLVDEGDGGSESITVDCRVLSKGSVQLNVSHTYGGNMEEEMKFVRTGKFSAKSTTEFSPNLCMNYIK